MAKTPTARPDRTADPFQPFQPDPNKTGASYIDPRTGKAIEGSAMQPTGTPYYASAPLTHDGTQTAAGTTSNAFTGYVGSQGGGFGGGNADSSDPALMSAIANGDQGAWKAGLSSADPAIKAAAQSYTLGYGSHGLGNTLQNGGTFEGAQAFSADNNGRMAGTYGDLLQQGYLNADGTPSTKYTTALAANQATQASQQPQASQAPAVDADPFGRFDNPAGPAQHGIITPAREAQLGAQADQIQQPALTDPNTGQRMQSATTATGTPNGSTQTPPLLVNPGLPPTGVTGMSGLTPSSVPPVSGQPPVTPPAVDPFQAFNPANPIPPVTPVTPMTGARSPALAAY